jgi:hypothetical protein
LAEWSVANGRISLSLLQIQWSSMAQISGLVSYTVPGRVIFLRKGASVKVLGNVVSTALQVDCFMSACILIQLGEEVIRGVFPLKRNTKNRIKPAIIVSFRRRDDLTS